MKQLILTEAVEMDTYFKPEVVAKSYLHIG